jgi:hypothetical protein
MARWCTYIKRYLVVPITSLLSFGLTAFISYNYIFVYLPMLHAKGYQAAAVIFGLMFTPFPILIYMSLFSIVCGNPGVMTKKL